MSAQATREYFEKGCLCILTNRLRVVPSETAEGAAERYMRDCKCSRNVGEYDQAHDARLRAEYLAKRQECPLPPAGWRCTRRAGHDGPCVAVVK